MDKKQTKRPVESLDPPGTGVVPVGPRGGDLTVSRGRYWTSLDLSTDGGRRLYMRCKNGADLTPADVMGKEFLVRDVLIHEVEHHDEQTGEVKDWVRYCLVTMDDKIVSGGSSGIRNSLADMFELFGPPPWVSGLKVRMVSRKTSNKFTVHLLEPV